MSQSDRDKWDQRYREGAYAARKHPSALLVEWLPKLAIDASEPCAIDLACGIGRNTLYLAQQGWRVSAVDISGVALDKLAAIGFNSVITCGFKNEEQPRGVFVVENGECVRAGDYDGSTPDWDMRADRSNWLKWAADGIGMAGLGTAFAMGKLKFLAGDFKGMIKDPRMATPFVKSFALMGKIETD